jgi:hypothetical protein
MKYFKASDDIISLGLRAKLLAGAVSMGLIFGAISASAARGGGGALSGGAWSFGLQGGTIGSTQDQMNTMISRANTRSGVGPLTNGQLSSAYEFAGYISYRFSGTMFEASLRPSYFFQASTGTGLGSSSYQYSINSYTIFPIMKIYPLESDFMKVYLQMGLGYGRISGAIDEGTAHAAYIGDAFGTVFGMGSQLCFYPSHCAVIEGNYRYLKAERTIVTASSGTFASGSLSNSGVNSELELDNTDVSANMSGLLFQIGYTYKF